MTKRKNAGKSQGSALKKMTITPNIVKEDHGMRTEVEGELESAIRKSTEDRPKTSCQRWRRYGRNILHSRVVLIIVVTLCFLDCALVIGELILDMHAIKEMPINQPGHSSGNDLQNYTDNATPHLVSTTVNDFEHHDRAVRSASDKKTDAHTTSDHEHEHPLTEKIGHAFHYASITILAILLVATIIKIVCEGKSFFKKKLEVFDAFIVLASFIIDLAFIKGITTLPIQESAYILSFILPWRVIRVVNSLVVAIMDHEHFKLLLVYLSKKRVSDILADTEIDLHLTRDQLLEVKKICLESGTEEWVINQALGRIASKSAAKHKCALTSFASLTAAAHVNEKRRVPIPKRTQPVEKERHVIHENVKDCADILNMVTSTPCELKPLVENPDTTAITFIDDTIDNTA